MSLLTPDGGLLFWMVIIFGVVFFILAKFGFPVITEMVEKRTEKINGALENARIAEQKLQSLREEHEQMLQQVKAEQTRIMNEALQAKENIIAQAKVQATDEAAKILAHAKTTIEAEKESALREIRQTVALLSVRVAEKVLREKLSSEDVQQEYIDNIINEMKS